MQKESTNRFEYLLANPVDPAKAQIRGKLIYILNSQGEILPSAESPLGILYQLLNSSDSTVDECQEIIQVEPQLAARIFRVANSAAFAIGATDISEALFHLGFHRLREIVFTSGVLAQLSQLKSPKGWDDFWLRNIFTARLSEIIASSYFPTDGSEYLAGLMHDVGWLFLATHFPDEFNTLVNSERPYAELEKEILPFSHADIAGAVAARSSLPTRTINSVMLHHEPLSPETGTLPSPAESARFLATILYVCDQMADSCSLGLFGQATTLKHLEESPEFIWLSSFGKNYDLQELIDQELPKSREIFKAFLS